MRDLRPDGVVGTRRYDPAMSATKDEWGVIERLLPDGWIEKARALGAFERSRTIAGPSDLLRLLLFHAVNDGGTRRTAAQARAAGIADVTGEALRKRMSTAGPWLSWIAESLCSKFREKESKEVPNSYRLRVVDSTMTKSPGERGQQHRLHYTIDLSTVTCDWHEVTDGKTPESLERVPISPGDLVVGDRNFAKTAGVLSVVDRGGHVLSRLQSRSHLRLQRDGDRVHALDLVDDLAVGRVGDWDAVVEDKGAVGPPVRARIVALRLPAPIAAKNRKRALRRANRQQRKAGAKALKAAEFLMLITTIPRSVMSSDRVLELYRMRWQIELVFKRLKQILRIGAVPNKVSETARSWIAAKLVMAALLEKLYRNAVLFSPWGYSL
jgi:DDE family transposase